MAGNKNSGNKESRSRNWTFLLYPESAPNNWRDMINEYHIPWVESPLHDKDLTETGEYKKPHIHVLLDFSGVKTYEQVKEITDKINCPIPQKCHNKRAMVRYMAHLDNPEKAQYLVTDIIGHNGVDAADYLKPSESEKNNYLREILNHIKDNQIIEFQDIVDYSAMEHFEDWFPMLFGKNSYPIQQYINSQRNRIFALKNRVNKETGEIE